MATYGSEAGVEALVPAVGDIDATTTPTTTQLTAWLAQGYAVINRHLAGAGYEIPVASGAAVYDELVALNNQYGAIFVIRSRGIDSVTGEGESVSDQMWEDFREQLHEVAATDLTQLGVSLATTSGTASRRRIRSMQLRRIDGYSGANETSETPYTNVSD